MAKCVVRKLEELYILVDYDEMAELDGNRNAPAIRNVPEIGWMDRGTHAPDISLAHDQKVDLWGLMTELKGKYGNVADLVAAGAKWLHAYPNLPDDLLTQVGLL